MHLSVLLVENVLLIGFFDSIYRLDTNVFIETGERMLTSLQILIKFIDISYFTFEIIKETQALRNLEFDLIC